MKTTKRQLQKAAQLWALSLIAHVQLDADTCDDTANEIREIALSNARRKLEQIGFDPAHLKTEKECLDALEGKHEP